MAESAMPQRAHAHPVNQPLYGAAADEIRDQLREPSDLAVAVRIAQLALNTYAGVGYGDLDGLDRAHRALTESLRILLRAVGAPVGEDR